MMAHLENERIAFTRRRANGQALFQLFFHDPNGVKSSSTTTPPSGGRRDGADGADLISGKPG